MDQFDNTYKAAGNGSKTGVPYASPAGPVKTRLALTHSLGSIQYLMATVFATVSLVLKLYTSTSGNRFLTSILSLADVSDLGLEEGTDILNSFNMAGMVGVFIVNLPMILLVLGMWISWTNSRSAAKTISTTGYSLIRGVNLFYMISLIVLLVICTIGMLVAIFAVSTGSEAYDSSTSVVLCLILVFMIAAFILAILYYSKTAAIFKEASRIASTGRTSGIKVTYVLVMNIFIVIFDIIGALTSLFIYFAMSELLGELDSEDMAGMSSTLSGFGIINMLPLIFTIVQIILLTIVYKRLSAETSPTFRVSESGSVNASVLSPASISSPAAVPSDSFSFPQYDPVKNSPQSQASYQADAKATTPSAASSAQTTTQAATPSAASSAQVPQQAMTTTAAASMQSNPFVQNVPSVPASPSMTPVSSSVGVKYCPQCGTKSNKSAVFCYSCGAKFPVPEAK